MKAYSWIKIVVAIAFLICAQTQMKAQRMALTTNLLEDAVATPNLGIDIVLADKQSVSFDASYSPYKLTKVFYNKRMTYRIGYKYWFTQSLYGHYIGADLVASSSDVGLAKWNFRDQYLGVGVGYGYALIIGKRWNLVPHIGLGLAVGNRFEGYDHMTDSGVTTEAVAKMGIKPIITRMGVTIQYVLN